MEHGNAPAQTSAAAPEDDDIDLGPSMFDEDAADMLGLKQAPAAKSVADMITPWGGYGGPKKRAAKLKSEPGLSLPCHRALCTAHCMPVRCLSQDVHKHAGCTRLS
jgi:hypothetical protein